MWSSRLKISSKYKQSTLESGKLPPGNMPEPRQGRNSNPTHNQERGGELGGGLDYRRSTHRLNMSRRPACSQNHKKFSKTCVDRKGSGESDDNYRIPECDN